MSNNLSDNEKMTLDYMKAALRKTIDPYDLRDDGVFSEMFLSPHVDILTPLLEFVDHIRLAQSLDNAKYISQERLDEIGRMFNEYRNYGSRSRGYATFVFDDIPDSGYITIPRGLVVTTRSGLKFNTRLTTMFDEVTIAQHYDPASFLYRIPIEVTSDGVGEAYNISANEISGVEGSSLENLVGVTNEMKFAGGEDIETNEEFSIRIRESKGAPNLGITRGYEKMLKTFPGVTDQKVVGYRHPLMKRDVIGDVIIPGMQMHEGITQKHWGSKVDLYIRGEEPVEMTDEFIVARDEQGRLFIKIDKNPIIGVRNIFMSAENVGFDLEETDIERLLINRYTVVRNEDFETFGTLEEECYIYFEEKQGTFDLFVGAKVNVNYMYNSLPELIDEFMYGEDEENRPPTADVKVKLGRKKFVVISIVAAMNQGSVMQISDELSIKNHLALGIEEVKMGGELQISDLVEQVYTQSGYSELNNIDYIDLPFQTLIFEHHNNLIFECLGKDKQENFYEEMLPEDMHAHFDYFKKNLTITEFLDALYILSRTPAFTNSDDVEEKIKFERYRILQNAYAAAGTPKVLSPDKVDASEIEFFELATNKVTEHIKLTDIDWVDFDYAFRSISQTDEAEEVNIEALTMFVIILALNANEATNKEEKIFNALKVLGNVEDLIEGDDNE